VEWKSTYHLLKKVIVVYYTFFKHIRELLCYQINLENEARKSIDKSKSRTSSVDILTDSEPSQKAMSSEKRMETSPIKPEERKSVEKEPPGKSPFKDVLTEKELQVKIADLGNACWTVSFSSQNIF
jgi:hypothetical protein